MGGLAGCTGGGGRLSLVVLVNGKPNLVSEKPNLVSEKSGNFINLWCWQPCYGTMWEILGEKQSLWHHVGNSR